MAETMDAATMLRNSGGSRPPRETSAPKVTPDPVQKLTDTVSGEDLTRDERKLRDQIAQAYTMVALGVGIIDQSVALAVMSAGEDAATAWVIYGRTNAKVKAALKMLTESSAAGMLVMAHLPIAMAIVPIVQERIRGSKPEETGDNPDMFMFQDTP